MRTPAALRALAAMAIVAGACHRPAPEPAPVVVDLGQSLSVGDPTWSGGPVFTYTPLETMAKSGYAAGRFATDEHFGTHVDAPAHFAPGGLTVDLLPPERLVLPAVRIDISAPVRQNEDYRLSLGDIEIFEREHGRIPPDTLVLVATGWSERWPGPGYMNVRDGVKHFPGISVEAAGLLAKDRRVAAIGIDTPSIDYGPSTGFEAHRLTMAAGVYHIENATRLQHVLPTGFTVVVAPVKVAGGSGAPTRVFALLPASRGVQTR